MHICLICLHLHSHVKATFADCTLSLSLLTEASTQPCFNLPDKHATATSAALISPNNNLSQQKKRFAWTENNELMLRKADFTFTCSVIKMSQNDAWSSKFVESISMLLFIDSSTCATISVQISLKFMSNYVQILYLFFVWRFLQI